jgi:hypothetical protein
MPRRTVPLLLFCALFALADLLIVVPGPHEGHSLSAWYGLGGRGQVALAQILGFLDGFDGHPAAPQAFRPTDWDIQVWQFFERERFEPVYQAQHGADCSAPPAYHVVTSAQDAVYMCNDHMMTSINGGYGQIVLTPNQLVDFSNGEAVIRWDMSTDLHSIRDWIEVNISPYDENLARTGDFDQGPPKHAVKFMTAIDAFRAEVSRDFTTESIQVNNDRGWHEFFVPSAVRRDTFEIHLSRTHLKIGLPAYNQWWVDRDINDLGWSRGILQISEHSYSATKACIQFSQASNSFEDTPPAVFNGADSCPNTWHWDNVSINPAIPFTIVKTDRRYAEAATPTLTLAQPAPANGYLRFAGLGKNLAFSTDGGATWKTALTAPMRDHDTTRWQTYWTPIAQGATSVKFRGDDDYFAWIADGVSVFSSTLPPPAPTPIATATPTRTPVGATATPTRTPAAATATPTRTPPAATATPASAPVFTSRLTASPSSVPAGQSVTFSASLTSSSATNAIVDIEVYAPNGDKVFQQYADNQSFTAGTERAFQWTWAVPATAAKGTYWVKIGVFSPGWTGIYHWNDSAGTVNVR